MPEESLLGHPGGMGEAEYRSLLCLDNEEVEQGGETIARNEGGISDLPEVLDAARDEANGLCRERASAPRLAELKRELAGIEARMARADGLKRRIRP